MLWQQTAPQIWASMSSPIDKLSRSIEQYKGGVRIESQVATALSRRKAQELLTRATESALPADAVGSTIVVPPAGLPTRRRRMLHRLTGTVLAATAMSRMCVQLC